MINMDYSVIKTKLSNISHSILINDPNTLEIIKNNLILLRTIHINTLLALYEQDLFKKNDDSLLQQINKENFINIYTNIRLLSNTPNLLDIQHTILNTTALHLLKIYNGVIVPDIIRTIKLKQTYSLLPILFDLNLDFPLLKPLIDHIKTVLDVLSTNTFLNPFNGQTLKKQVFDQLPSYIVYICDLLWKAEKLPKLLEMVNISVHKTFTNNIPCLIQMDDTTLRNLGIKESLLQFDNTDLIKGIVIEFSKTAPANDIEKCVNILIRIFETVPFPNTRDVDNLVKSFLSTISSKEAVLDFLFFRDNNKVFWNKCWCDIVEDEFEDNTLGIIPYDEATIEKNFTSKNLLPSFLDFLGDKTQVISEVSNVIIYDMLNMTDKWKKIEENEENIRRIFPDHLVENIFIKIKEIKEKMISLDNWCLDDEHRIEINMQNEQFFELEEKEKCVYAKQNGIELKLLGNIGFVEIVTDKGIRIKMLPIEFLMMEAINKQKWAFEKVLCAQFEMNEHIFGKLIRNMLKRGIIRRETVDGSNEYIVSVVI